MPSAPPPDASADPVLVRRRKWARFAEVGQRVGYGCYALSLALFFLAMGLDLPKAVVDLVVVLLIVGSVVLAPAIVVGYGVKAADREDRERGLGGPS
jgi:hypothetical protein